MTPEYQAEVDHDTAKLERAYRAAERRLAAAESRLRKVQQDERPNKKTGRAVAVAWELVQLRREELEQYRRAMVAVPASLQHRGTEGYRPVPPTQGIGF